MRQIFGVFAVLLMIVGGVFAQDDPTPTGRESVIATATAIAETITTPPAPPTDRERTAPGTNTDDVRVISVGDPYRDELSAARPAVRVAFRAQAGTPYTITLSSDSFDTYLMLLDPDGTVLQQNDDGGASTNSQISAFTPPVSGLYVLEATSFSNYIDNPEGESGLFTLTVNTVDIAQLAYGDRVESTISQEGGSASFLFSGTTGDVVLVSLQSDDFDTYLTLTDPSGVVTENDDGGENTNSQIGPLLLPSTGNYVVTARSFSSGGVGAYTLALEQVSLQRAALGETVTIAPNSGSSAIQFEASEGDIISVVVAGGDTNVLLQDPYGYDVFGNEDSAVLAERALYLDYSGDYILLLQGPIGSALKVTIRSSELPALTAGANTVTFGPDGSAYRSFEVEAGERIGLTFVPLTAEDYWNLNVEVVQNGNYLAYYSGSGGDSLSFAITFVMEGTVTLDMTQYSDMDEAEIVLERLGAE